MCRYAWVRYKPHHACFACRKAFKRRRREDVDPEGTEHPARCPECGGKTADMGLDFRPPKRNDVTAWRAAEELFTAGITFRSCGCDGPGYRPVKPREVEAFTREHRQSLLKAYRPAVAPTSAESGV